MKQVVLAIILIGSFAGSAMAQALDFIGISLGIPLAPGQAGTSPGQVYNVAKATDSTTALSPGKLYILNRTTDPTTALPPGKTFTNHGRSKK